MNIEDLIKRIRETAPTSVLGKKVNPEALAYITVADSAFKSGDYGEAIMCYTKAIDFDPENYYPYSQRGGCYRMTQKYDEALDDFFKSKRLSDSFENNQSIALCYLSKKDFASAVEFFNLAIPKLDQLQWIDTGGMLGIEYDSTKSRALNNLGYCYLNLGQFDKAIESTSEGIRLSPQYSNNYCTRGMAYLRQGNEQKGMADLQHAASLDDLTAQEILSRF